MRGSAPTVTVVLICFVVSGLLPMVVSPRVAAPAPLPRFTTALVTPPQPRMNEPPSAADTWTNLTPAIHPGARSSAGMVYDSRHDRCILFGGWNATGPSYFMGDTWAFDYVNNSWSQRLPATSPMAREDFGMAYDSAADRSIVFGGFADGAVGINNETWAYDYANNTWTQRFPASSPPARLWGELAYDSESDRTILFGGTLADGVHTVADTWSYDYRTNTWTNVTTSEHPPESNGFAFTYASPEDRVVLYTGGYGLTETFDDNTNTWSPLSSPAFPSNRAMPVMVYDAFADRVILFGGYTLNPSPLSAETWSLSVMSGTWTLRSPAIAPPPRDGASMAYDEQAKVTILFGGDVAVHQGAGIANGDDTWAFRAAGLPSQPLALTAVTGSGTVRLTWEPPASDGGTDLARYSLYRGTSPETLTFLASAPVGWLLYIDSGLVNGQPYYYALSVTNRIGEGPRTSVVRAVPTALAVTASANVTSGFAPLLVAFHAAVAGGRAPYSPSWEFSDHATALGADCTHLFSVAGNYTAELTVRDADGMTNVTTIAIRVSPSPPPNPNPGNSNPVTPVNGGIAIPVWGWILALAALAAAIAAVLLWRRRIPREPPP